MTSKNKLKVAILFGGKSGEHEVSLVSATSVAKALDKNKYDIVMIGIDKTGRWILPSEKMLLEHQSNPREMKLDKVTSAINLPTVQDPKIDNRQIDVIFPVLHGTYGEDGTIQGFLELANLPYVGSGVLGSALGMDKDMAKKILKHAEIPVVPWVTLKKFDYKKNPEKTIASLISELGLPFFAKPSSMGSSVGVHKIKTAAEAREKIEDAFLYDNKILCEKFIPCRELEVSVLGTHDPKSSIVGEIIPTHEFYSYEAKYLDENGANLDIPAKNLTAAQSDKIRELAVKTFKELECRGMARVDFFMDKTNGDIYLNEVNTIPGFTNISMYPKLWNATGLGYADLLDQLIEFALEQHREKNELKTSWTP